MTGLDALRARGWEVTTAENDGVPPEVTVNRPYDDGAGAFVLHPERDTVVRMAVAAALVAEGHDLIGLLRDARRHIEFGWHPEDDTELYAVIAGVDAVLAAVDGET